MEFSGKQTELLNRRKIIVLATSDLEGKPRASLVEVNKVENDKIVITDNEMATMRNNLVENKKIACVAFEEDYSYCLKILGEAEYCVTGEYFDFVKSLDANKGQNPKGAIVITAKEIIEFK